MIAIAYIMSPGAAGFHYPPYRNHYIVCYVSPPAPVRPLPRSNRESAAKLAVQTRNNVESLPYSAVPVFYHPAAGRNLRSYPRRRW